jgi:hypothetical protein
LLLDMADEKPSTQIVGAAGTVAHPGVEHVDEHGNPAVLQSETTSTKVFNPLLILACFAFGSLVTTTRSSHLLLPWINSYVSFIFR